MKYMGKSRSVRHPAVGQIWSARNHDGGRFRFRVDGFTTHGGHQCAKISVLGRTSARSTITIATLIRGQRSSRLEVTADGKAVANTDNVRISDVDGPAVRRAKATTLPKGLLNVTPRMQRLASDHASGVSIGALCERYGVSRHTVGRWVATVAEAKQDSANLGAVRS